MKKTIFSMLLVLCMLVTYTSFASINGIQADNVFTSKTAVLNSSGYLSVYLETINYSNIIRINCNRSIIRTSQSAAPCAILCTKNSREFPGITGTQEGQKWQQEYRN